MKRGPKRLDGLDDLLPGRHFVRECIRQLSKAAFSAPIATSEPRTGRDLDFIERFRRGETLQQIGDAWGISRERVRQRLSIYGLTRNFGGAAARAVVTARQRADAKHAAHDAKCLRLFGVTQAILYDITGMGSIKGVWAAHKRRTNPIITAYINQKRAAEKRGIGWELTLADWWRIWRDSGKWGERGRGYGYCMARWGDDGPYSVDNVYICTGAQNSSDSYLVHPAAERHEKFLARKASNALHAATPQARTSQPA